MEITELPLKCCTFAYKELVLDRLLEAQLIDGISESNASSLGKVRFVCKMKPALIAELMGWGVLEEVFGLRRSFNAYDIVSF